MKIIAHRGNDGIHKENSLEAILNSLKQKYVDGVEFDIRKTKDNKFVIIHDPFYQGYLISNTKLIKLQKLGLNSLQEVLEKVNNKKILLIELKSQLKNKKDFKSLYKILTKNNLNIYLCSFHHETLKKFKTLYPTIKCGLIIALKKDLKNNQKTFDFISLNYHIKKIFKIETFFWTINTKQQLEKISKNDNIITDFPKKIYKIIYET